MLLVRFCTLGLLLASLSAQAEVYRWINASGGVVFGDHPPDSASAMSIDLPLLTVADSFTTSTPHSPQVPIASAPVLPSDRMDQTVSEETDQAYHYFSVLSPAANANIRTNNGLVVVELAINPSLKKGHGLVLYLDGKQVAKSASAVISLSNVAKGQHSLFVVLHDERNRMLSNTEAVSFTVSSASTR